MKSSLNNTVDHSIAAVTATAAGGIYLGIPLSEWAMFVTIGGVIITSAISIARFVIMLRSKKNG